MSRTSYLKAMFLLSLQDFAIRYKLTFLGILWSVISPTIHIFTLTIVFSYFLRFDIENYPLYLSCGVLSWQLFTGVIKSSSTALIDNRELILNSNSPPYMYVLSSALAEYYRFIISYYTIIFMISFFYNVGASTILGPIFALPLLITAYFLGFGLAFLVPKYRDVSHIVDVLLSSLYWTVPIFYTLTIIAADVADILVMNPLYWLIKPVQDVAYFKQYPIWSDYLKILVFISGAFVFFLISKAKSKFVNLHI